MASFVLWVVNGGRSGVLPRRKVFNERSWRHVKDAIDPLHLCSPFCLIHFHHTTSHGCFISMVFIRRSNGTCIFATCQFFNDTPSRMGDAFGMVTDTYTNFAHDRW